MIEGWLDREATGFWVQVGVNLPFPRNLESVVSRGLPLSYINLSKLSINRVEQWFFQRQIPFNFLCKNRDLCGCIVATRGKGFLFIDEKDSEDERRFTIAHEIAHFILDYLYPRQHAIDHLGVSIRSVLDGERKPTMHESIDAALSNIKLGIYIDMMPRSVQGGIEQSAILRSEDNADRLAFELLAPAERVLNHPAVSQAKLPFDRARIISSLLSTEYGLPQQLAHRYSAFLTRHYTYRSTAEWLGL